MHKEHCALMSKWCSLTNICLLYSDIMQLWKKNSVSGQLTTSRFSTYRSMYSLHNTDSPYGKLCHTGEVSFEEREHQMHRSTVLYAKICEGVSSPFLSWTFREWLLYRCHTEKVRVFTAEYFLLPQSAWDLQLNLHHKTCNVSTLSTPGSSIQAVSGTRDNHRRIMQVTFEQKVLIFTPESSPKFFDIQHFSVLCDWETCTCFRCPSGLQPLVTADPISWEAIARRTTYFKILHIGTHGRNTYNPIEIITRNHLSYLKRPYFTLPKQWSLKTGSDTASF